MAYNNPYTVLGVTSGAKDEEIKSAYRNLVKRYHPDRFLTYAQKVWATKKMQEINDAFTILRNASLRKQFDSNPQERSFGTSGVHRTDRTDHAASSRARAGSDESYRASSTPRAARNTGQESRWSVWWDKWKFRMLLTGWIIASVAVYLYIVLPISPKLTSAPIRVSISLILFAMAGGAGAVAGIVSQAYLVGLMFRFVGRTFQHGFEKKSEPMPSRAWRDLGVRLGLLTVILVSVLYWNYVSPGIWVLLIAFPINMIFLIPFAMILGETLALLLYVYRARTVAETAEILLRD